MEYSGILKYGSLVFHHKILFFKNFFEKYSAFLKIIYVVPKLARCYMIRVCFSNSSTRSTGEDQVPPLKK
jgi:hypothetical protein